MKLGVSTRESLPNPQAGFSLIELLVSLFIAGVMLGLVAGFFQIVSGLRYRMISQTEAQQGLRALLESITQELRQAGACLPGQGQFVALEGRDNGDSDQLTLRIGRTTPGTLQCIQTATTAPAADGDTTLTVRAGEGDLFADASLVYVTPNGATGAFHTVASTTATTITLKEGIAGVHPPGTGISAVDERIYTVTTLNGRQVLAVQIDRDGITQPLIDGVEQFNIQYFLGPCPPAQGPRCNAVNQPVDATQWRRVREMLLSATVRSSKTDKDGHYARESGQVAVKPRNLL